MNNPQSAMRNPQLLVRPLVRRLHAYVPGEQPKIKGLIKLNTNENPYPPSPRVLAAIKRAVDGRLRLYPNPTADALRGKLAKHHGCAVENLIVGNGSDELLEMAVRAFVEPTVHGAATPMASPGTAAFSRTQPPQSLVQYFTPSYSLYPVLADMHGAAGNAVPLRPDFGLPSVAELRRRQQWDFGAALTFVTTPNAPTGRGYPIAELEALCRAQRGVVVLDETYVDFADGDALALALKHPHVIVSRTFSKAYSLCFQRVGYFVGHAALIEALHRIRDSYNVNGLGQVAAEATLDDLGYYRRNFQRVIATRERVAAGLTRLGFEVRPSQTNFLFVRPPRFSAEQWLGRLRERKVLVRWFASADVRDFLRVSIGTGAEMDALLRAVRAVRAGRYRK
jgi:histidinol-phosphate aminotransferase